MNLYIFVGMYDGVNDKIEPYVNEADADKAFEDYTGHSYPDFEEDSSLLEYTKYEGSTIYSVDFPMECYDPARKIAIIWSIEDVNIVRPDLTDEQALAVLTKVKDKHDAEMGVTWTTLEEWADILYPRESNQSDSDKLTETALRLYKANSAVSDGYTAHDALFEAFGIHGIRDLHNDEADERYGEYEDLVCSVNTSLGIND